MYSIIAVPIMSSFAVQTVQNLFEKALTNGGLEALDGEEYAYHGNGDAAGKSTNAVLDQWADGEGLDDEVDEDGWDLDAVTSPQVHVGHGAAPEEAEEEEEIEVEREEEVKPKPKARSTVKHGKDGKKRSAEVGDELGFGTIGESSAGLTHGKVRK